MMASMDRGMGIASVGVRLDVLTGAYII